MKKKWKIALVVAIAAVAISGCAQPTPSGVMKPIETRLPQLEPGVILSDMKEIDLHEEYRIGYRDKISIEVVGHGEFSGEFKVDANGNIGVPLIDKEIRVYGMTLGDAAYSFLGAIYPSYLRFEPTVRVQLIESQSKRYFVLGGVDNPGEYPLGLYPVYLRDALLQAGLRDDARLERVFVIEPSSGEPTFVVIDARELFFNQLRHNIRLRNGDVIYIPSK